MNRQDTGTRRPDLPEPTEAEVAEHLEFLRRKFGSWAPHTKALGVRLDSIERDGVVGSLSCRPEFIGDPQRGVIHTGVIASMIDSIAGCAVNAHLGRRQRIATLDLRIDYLRPSFADADLHCHGECYRVTTHIAFARALVWQHDREQPVASSLITFMHSMTRSGEPK